MAGDAVQQIKDKLDIVDVISPYVELKKAGKNYKGKSPFSAEKTPSFYVSPDRGMYYCFSTSQGGDMFTFIQTMEGVDFKGALTQLAEKAGVELVPEDPKQRSERDRQYAALTAAAEFYSSELSLVTSALSYLKGRGVTDTTIQAWQIGYAPGPPQRGWRETKSKLEAQGFTTDELLKVGLIKTTEGGKEPFDVFRDRIVFPMCDPSGRVVAFSGRLLATDSEAPKYVNSPETALYKKSELLYGYDKAKSGIRSLGFSLIVEGQFDVVMSHQAGYHNTVAVSGTALTPHHVGLLERLSDKVVLALDADRAGVAAMKKAAELMLGRGLDVKVAPLPDGEDPADITADDPARFKQVIGRSVPVIEFLLQAVITNEQDARTRKLKVRDEVLPYVLLLPNRIDQEHFVGVIAEAIGSTTDAIRYEVDRLRDSHPIQSPEVPIPAVAAEPTTSPSGSMQNAYAYLQAVVELIEEPVATVVRDRLTALPPHDLSVPAAEQAKLAFTMEEYITAQPRAALLEDIISRLNYLQQKLLQQHLATVRQAMAAAEAGREDITEHLTKITELQESLRAPRLTTEIFSQEV